MVVTVIAEILSRSVAYIKCTLPENDCKFEVAFIIFGMLYIVGAMGTVYQMLSSASQQKKRL